MLMSSRIPREYLLAVRSRRIAVVGTKVFKLSPLSIVRSNRLARLNVESGIRPLFCRSTFAPTPSYSMIVQCLSDKNECATVSKFKNFCKLNKTLVHQKPKTFQYFPSY